MSFQCLFYPLEHQSAVTPDCWAAWCAHMSRCHSGQGHSVCSLASLTTGRPKCAQSRTWQRSTSQSCSKELLALARNVSTVYLKLFFQSIAMTNIIFFKSVFLFLPGITDHNFLLYPSCSVFLMLASPWLLSTHLYEPVLLS